MNMDSMDFDRSQALTIGAAVIIAGLVLGVVAVDQTMVQKQTDSFEASATVYDGNATDFGVDTDRTLNFGEVPSNFTSAVRREINVQAAEGSKVSVTAEGNISEHLEFEQESSNGDRTITVEFTSSEPGDYEGTVTVKTLSPENSLAKRWIDIRY